MKDEGMTLIEVMISISVIAIAAVSLLYMFAFAARHTKEASSSVQGAFVLQREMERLKEMDYLSAVAECNGIRRPFEGYYVELNCRPYYPGVRNFFQVVVQNRNISASGCDFYIVTPDGQVVFRPVIDGYMANNFNFSSGNYSVTSSLGGDNLSVSGTLPEPGGEILVAINMLKYDLPHTIDVNITAGGYDVKIVIYDTQDNSDSLNVYGVPAERYHDYLYRNFSLLAVEGTVYKSETDSTALVAFENIIELEN